MPYKSNIPKLAARLQRAREGGLRAAANALKSRIVRDLKGGYTSGDFSQGYVAGSVTIGTPQLTPESGSITVGSDVPYALYWELGHLNIFIDGPIEGVHGVRTGPIRRVEIWVPALQSEASAMRAAYARTLAKVLKGLSGDDVTGNVTVAPVEPRG